MNYSLKANFYNNVLGKLIKAGKVLGAVLLSAVLVGLVLFLTVDRIAVFCDGEVETVYTFFDTPEEIVAKTSFTVGEKDRIITFETESGDEVVAVAKEHTVKIYDGKKLVKKMKFTGTVGEALQKAGITLENGDEANYDSDFGITEDLTIKVVRGFKVTLVADGATREINFSGGTVKKLLKKAGIAVSDIDMVTPSLDSKVKKGTVVTVKRVRYEHEKEKGTVKYETKVEYDDSKYQDEVKVKVKGKNGKKTDTVRKIFVDGEYLKSEIIDTVITKEPVTKVVVRGTKIRPGGAANGGIISELKPPFEIQLDERGRPIKYKKLITGKATAYCTGTTCSTGVRAMPGRVAVDPREIPYGTKMYIVSSDGKWNYGYCTASDTGGFIYTSSTVVDLYMRSYTDCINFGRRNVEIYILE